MASCPSSHYEEGAGLSQISCRKDHSRDRIGELSVPKDRRFVCNFKQVASKLFAHQVSESVLVFVYSVDLNPSFCMLPHLSSSTHTLQLHETEPAPGQSLQDPTYLQALGGRRDFRFHTSRRNTEGQRARQRVRDQLSSGREGQASRNNNNNHNIASSKTQHSLQKTYPSLLLHII
jgi:hypothetical protein